MTRKITCYRIPDRLVTAVLITWLVMAFVSPCLAESVSTGSVSHVYDQPATTPVPGTDAIPDGTGDTGVLSATGTGDRIWHFDLDTSTFKPDEYIVTVSAVREDATGTSLFNVLDDSSATRNSAPRDSPGSPVSRASSGYYITIDQIGDRHVGDMFTITGRTNIPEGAEMLVQVYSSSFRPTQKSQSGEFSGTTGTVSASDPAIPVAALAPMAKDSGDVDSQAKIIRTGSVTLEVPDVTGAVVSFQALATNQGGYISSSTVQAEGNRHSGTVILRVPQARFETTLDGVKSSGIVKYVTTQGEDVTEEYVDLQAQKTSYQVQLAQYYVLMKKAVNVSDILAIQQQIDRIQTELNRLEGRLNYLDSRIELSTITITLNEPAPEPVPTDTRHNFMAAVNTGVEGLFGLVDATIITLIIVLPVIVLAVIGVCFYRWRKGKQPVRVSGETDDQKKSL